VWWIRLGIIPERIEPGQPQQNGRHERMHRTLKEHTASPPAASMAAQQRAFDVFRADFNDHRPHEALGQTPPAQHYEASFRPMPARLLQPQYADDFVQRGVKEAGTISWKGKILFVGRPLQGQRVGLRQTDEDEWELFFGPILLGYLLTRDGCHRIEPIG
jgi:hypothetical protein